MDLLKIKDTVLISKPKLAGLIRKFGELSLFDYTKNEQVKIFIGEDKIKTEFLAVFYKEASRLFGSDVAKEASDQLAIEWYVSTAEHHDPVCHPFDLSGSLVRSFVNSASNFSNIIILSCSNISLNNSSFPRGIFWHDKNLDQQRFYLQPWKMRQLSVCAAPKYQKQDILKQIKHCLKINSLVSDVYLDPEVLGSENYADQISRSNRKLWKKISGQQDVEMLYIPQEKIVSDLIVNFHLNQNTEINNLIFNKVWRKAFSVLFDGSIGAFNSKNKSGSFLFWGLKDGVRINLYLNHDKLVSSDGLFSVKLTPQSVEANLQNGFLVPTMALSFIVLAFYYRLVCGGGFSQVDYLPKLQELWNKLLNELGSKNLSHAKTDYLSADYAFVSLQNLYGKSILSSAIDLYLYQEKETGKFLENLSKTYTVEAALDNLMPEFYSIVGNNVSKDEVVIKKVIPASIYAK